MKAKLFAEACAKFAESHRIDPASGTLLNLGLCHEAQGKLATALTEMRETLAMSLREHNEEREIAARQGVARIEPRLARLTITLPLEVEKLPGLTVSLDGVELGSAGWKTAIPVDPGAHELRARAAGRVERIQSVRVADGEQANVSLLALELEHRPGAAAGGDRGGANRVIGWTTLSLGAIGLGLAGGFGFAALGKRQESDKDCTGGTCRTQAGVDANEAAKGWARSADVAFGIGAVLAATGVVLLLTAPSSETGRGVQAYGTFNGDGFSLRFSGRF